MNKQVQEIAAECDQLPERFIRKQDKEYGNVSDSGQAELPFIDVSLLTSSPLELEKLKSAVTTWGCFQAVNHGIEMERVREIGKLFFGLSADEKKKYLRDEDDVDGYGNDMVLSDDQILDWADRLYLTVLPEDKRKMQFWPQNPPHFREVLDEYTSKIELIYEVTLKALARSLNLEEDCFLNQIGTTAPISARYNYYPTCPRPEKVLGVKPHADSSAITLLLQDKEVAGLQLLKDNQWVGVPVVPDALTINVGDQIEIMSNGIFKSPVHRVLVNSRKERMTLAVFCPVLSDKVIGPVDGLITDETPRLYKNVIYSLDFFFKIYQQGGRPIDACKI
ncbi:putative codeine 3-O-demethylase [Helianthus annuus]|uniref:Codeine 3-O-demethylase n=1 Tax=Helianthus annuus TaxID=4232 RepID=A0A251UPP4_HELAN|nr:codeine O-demethylase [Helianthus annuus]KAF5805141.1 putative codeine 3-O-demethylase [Helianthus annuus]KAJ0918227.1 putative codeine 3-O-demethylase [Helianthus annuus]KAJ0922007.1 putative codeine 3-O-demethylase [Helianthus annuus]